MSSSNGPRNSEPLATLIGQIIVLDLCAHYVCIGTLAEVHAEFLELTDADLHDFRDSSATRELYVVESRRIGIRRNRERVWIRRHEIVGVSRFHDVVES